jgi:hypothetical protein
MDQFSEIMIGDTKFTAAAMSPACRRDAEPDGNARGDRGLVPGGGDDSKIGNATHKTSYPKSPARGAPGWPSPEPASGLGVKGGTPAALIAIENK